MIEMAAVGPPLKGLPGPSSKTSAKEDRGEGPDAFARQLETRLKTKSVSTDKSPKGETKSTDEPTDLQPVKVKPEKESGPPTKNERTARDAAIQKFMDSVESEFGIPPTRIVEAMALLKPEELQMKPEESAEAVLRNLDVSEADHDEMKAMYLDLLHQLNTLAPNPTPLAMAPEMMVTTAAFAGGDALRGRVLQAQERREELAHAVDRLNDKFWMKNPAGNLTTPMAPPVAPTGLEGRMMVDESLLAEGEGTLDGLDAEGMETAPATPMPERALRPGEPAPLPVDPGLVTSQGEAAPQAVKAAPSANTRGLLSDLKRAVAEGGDPVRSAAVMNAAPALSKATTSANASAVEAASVSAAPGAALIGAAALLGRSSGDAGSDSGFTGSDSSDSNGEKPSTEKSTDAFSSALGAKTPVPLKMEDVAAALKAMPPTAAAVAAAALNKSGDETNIRQVINQAQYLIKRGGGEVNVQMNPEGLGQVRLKVLLQDGKVGVQMQAESPEAKRIIESSLSELKTQLAAHKLSMDHVKVDVIAGTNTDTATRNESNMNDSSQRDSTKQFWNQFQENFGNRSQRDGYGELPDLKGYRKSREPAPLQTMTSTSLPAKAQRSDGRGRSVDVVA